MPAPVQVETVLAVPVAVDHSSTPGQSGQGFFVGRAA